MDIPEAGRLIENTSKMNILRQLQNITKDAVNMTLRSNMFGIYIVKNSVQKYKLCSEIMIIIFKSIGKSVINLKSRSLVKNLGMSLIIYY